MIETDNDYFCDEECKDDFEEGAILSLILVNSTGDLHRGSPLLFANCGRWLIATLQESIMTNRTNGNDQNKQIQMEGNDLPASTG